jgi:fumarylacetoacetase
MGFPIDQTHDPALVSWVDSANDPASDFPIQNLPFGRFRSSAEPGPWRLGVAIGDAVLDLNAAGVVGDAAAGAVLERSIAERRELRERLSAGLRRGSEKERQWRGALLPLSGLQLGLPCDIRGYTDFYTGIHHARAVGRLFRPDNPLLPNYQWVPIGYHGRTSSILPSGTAFLRPHGQIKPPDAGAPQLAASRRIDYELELGIIIGRGNALGAPIPIDEAEDHVLGLTLLNDWSARDIQAFEYQPLGPFLAKNFATTLSPWIVTLEALAPFREPFERSQGDPQPLPYLDCEGNRRGGVIGVDLQVWIQTERMRQAGAARHLLSQSSYRDAYWTMAQLVAHHTINGCNLQSGDLLGTGTLSGPQAGQGGSLLELSAGGKSPVALPNGEVRTFLEDGDEITLRGYCEREGFRRIGLGECRAAVLGAER